MSVNKIAAGFALIHLMIFWDLLKALRCDMFHDKIGSRLIKLKL